MVNWCEMYEYQSHLLLAAAGLSVYWLYTFWDTCVVLCDTCAVLYYPPPPDPLPHPLHLT